MNRQLLHETETDKLSNSYLHYVAETPTSLHSKISTNGKQALRHNRSKHSDASLKDQIIRDIERDNKDLLKYNSKDATRDSKSKRTLKPGKEKIMIKLSDRLNKKFDRKRPTMQQTVSKRKKAVGASKSSKENEEPEPPEKTE